MKLNRNDLCWCGSNKKYKKCHWKEDQQKTLLQNSFSEDPKKNSPYLKNLNPQYIKGMKATCQLAKQTLNMVEKNLEEGITTNQINNLVHNFILDHHAIPAPLNYRGFPKSVCTSINEVICHGIPSERILKSGDIINVDVTCILDGYYGDTSRTFIIGEPSHEAQKIVNVAYECLQRATDILKPYLPIGNIGAVIQDYAHSQNCSVVEQYVGHGIGKDFHTDPSVPHFGKSGTGPLLLPGMFFTIEPMINLGVKYATILDDGWTAVTSDGKLSAQFEHTFMVTNQDVQILT